MPIAPVRDLLYIIPLDRPEKIGSIHLPDSHEPRTNQGIVKYRGPDTDPERSGIRVGDHVYFSGYVGDEIVFEDEGRLIVVPEHLIHAKDGGDPDPNNMTLSVANFKLFLDRATENFVRRFAGDLDKQKLINDLKERMMDELDGILAQEMHF
jgi:co-chaperonin GroES (HSP10)